MKALLRKIRRILRDKRTRRLLTRTVCGFAAVIVFITTYALILPAITMETDADCSIEAHQHDESCYAEVLVCDLPELDGHHHTSACHHDSAVPVCGLEETDGHTHTSACFEKVLICDREVHIHSAACYRHDSESLAGEGAAGAGLSDPDAPGTPVDSASSASRVSNTDLTSAGVNSTASSNAVSNVSSAASSNAVPNDVFTASDESFSPDSCMPTLEPLHFDAILTDRTGIYRNRKLYF